ncbi:MAG: energy-coupling factor ABC transporter ATP-binding protein [Candidatus Heimdallarchaeota archaeon]
MTYITLNKVNFSYRKNVPLFQDLNLTFNLGEQVSFLGRNGAGKTTLVKLLLGMLRPSSGTIRIDGENIKGKSIADIATKVGFVFQNPNLMLFTNSVEKELNLSLMRFNLPKEEINEKISTILDFFEMQEYREANPRNLSRGEKQKLTIASVLIQDPQVIILDEPFSGIDMTQRLLIADYLDTLRDQGKLIILITHNLDLILEKCSRVIGLKEGTLHSDSPTMDFLADFDNLQELGLEKTNYLTLIESLRKFGLPKSIFAKNDLIQYLSTKGSF